MTDSRESRQGSSSGKRTRKEYRGDRALRMMWRGDFKSTNPEEMAIKAYVLGHPRIPADKAKNEAKKLWDGGEFDSRDDSKMIQKAFLFDRRSKEQLEAREKFKKGHKGRGKKQ